MRILKELISPRSTRGCLLVFIKEFLCVPGVTAVKTVFMDRQKLAAVLRIDSDIVIGKIAGPDVF